MMNIADDIRFGFKIPDIVIVVECEMISLAFI